MTGLAGWLAFGTMLTMTALWLRALRRLAVGTWLPVLDGLGLAVLGLGVAGLFGDGATRWLAIAALPLPLAFFALKLFAAEQPANRIAVAVGEPIIDFTAIDADGQPFDLASLRGTPFLLKFYRGHW